MVSPVMVTSRAALARTLPPPSPSTVSFIGVSAALEAIAAQASAGKSSSRAVV